MFTTRARLMATRVFKKFGFTIVPLHETWDHQRANVLSRYNPEIVFDIGANVGQWYLSFREVNQSAVVYSFEPDWRAFLELEKLHESRKDANWFIVNKAIGAETGKSTMSLWDVAGGSSSLKELTSDGELFTGQTQSSFDVVEIDVCSLDDFIRDNLPEFTKGFLKLDVQGFELEVLTGATNALLGTIELIEIEIPFRPIYVGDSNIESISALLSSNLFTALTFQTKRWNEDLLAAADFDAIYIRDTRQPR
jgi:FkbM family methyltransferase